MNFNSNGGGAMYTGHIYNNEGFPISGLAVSDGRNISITDEDGCYSLQGWERESMIFVQALTRRHDDWYKRIESGVYEYDFTVDIYEGGKSSSYLHISDTEIFVDDASAEDWLGFISDSIEKNYLDIIYSYASGIGLIPNKNELLKWSKILSNWGGCDNKYFIE
jgi:hypothetical protein